MQPDSYPAIPKYLEKYVEELNLQKDVERSLFEDAKKYVQIFVEQPTKLDLLTRKMPQKYDLLKEGI